MSKEAQNPLTNNFSQEQITAANIVKKKIIESDEKELQSVYMAGEICMYQELSIALADKEEEIKALREALQGLLDGIRPEDACRGKYILNFTKGTKEYEEYSKKAYVGSKGIPTDEQILTAIEVLTKQP